MYIRIIITVMSRREYSFFFLNKKTYDDDQLVSQVHCKILLYVFFGSPIKLSKCSFRLESDHVYPIRIMNVLETNANNNVTLSRIILSLQQFQRRSWSGTVIYITVSPKYCLKTKFARCKYTRSRRRSWWWWWWWWRQWRW